MQLTTDGIILRDCKIEDDRVLRILTRDYGVLSAFANGANRTRSKLASSTELLCYSHLVLFHSRDRYVVDSADAGRIFFGIRGDLDKLSLASYLAELAGELCPHGEPAPEHLRLLLNSLHCLEKGRRDAALLKAMFELRLLTLSGYMPNLVGCRECGSYEAERMLFSPAQGDLLCGGCAARASLDGMFHLTPGVLAAMRHIIYSQPEKLFSFALSEEGTDLLGRVCEYYLHSQVEKTFPTLEFYNSLRRMPAQGSN